MIYLSMLASALIGFLFAYLWFKRLCVGTLRFDRSDPDDQANIFLELSEHPEIVSRKDYVILKVSNENYISHE